MQFSQGKGRSIAAMTSVAALLLWVGESLPLLVLAATPPPITQPRPKMTPQAALERLFTSDPIAADWFAPDFLAAVPVNQVRQIIAQLKAELGPYQSVQVVGQEYRVLLERGFVPTNIVLNGQGQIAGLFFQPPRLQMGQLSEVVAAFQALPGQVSVLVLEGTTERAALNATIPLAIGSAFKLVVLEALRQQIASGQHTWAEVVPLQAAWKSLPSGFLQTWADGSLLTLQSLATLMISQSDNTATDHLIQRVGRDAIEALTPRNRPFLTTREAFVLKSDQQAKLRQQYQAADVNKRRQLLAEVAKQRLPAASEFTAAPRALEIEWFLSTQELCQMMARVQDLPLMQVNPGVAKPEDWAQIAFKGGSEPGVLNLTTALRSKRGKQYCVSATWNHTTALEESRFFTLYASLLETLKD